MGVLLVLRYLLDILAAIYASIMGDCCVYYMTLDLGADVPWVLRAFLARISPPFMACVVEDDMTEGRDSVVLMERWVSGPRGRPEDPRTTRWAALIY